MYVVRFHVEHVENDGNHHEVGKWVTKNARLTAALSEIMGILQSVLVVFTKEEDIQRGGPNK